MYHVEYKVLEKIHVNIAYRQVIYEGFDAYVLEIMEW